MGSPSRNQKQSSRQKLTSKKGKDESLIPLSNKTFYLDVKGFKGIELLSFDIKLLGGSIENFLSKEISCVITNRSDGKFGESSLLGNIASPLISTPSSLSARSCTNFDSPNTFESPGDDRQKKLVKSRGEALLEKAMKSGIRGTSDVLQNARKWGVQVISLPKFLDWVSKYKASHNIRKEPLKDSQKGKSISSASVIKLSEPFVKLEAVNRHYKPVYKQLQSWPELNVMVPSNSSPFTLLTRKEKARNQKKVCVPETPVTSESESEFSDSFQNKKKLSLTINELYRNSGYCEICSVSYNDLNKHLQTKEHKAFVQNHSNYISLDELISDGNNIGCFLNTTDYRLIVPVPDEDEVNLLSPLHYLNTSTKIETNRRNDRKRHMSSTHPAKKIKFSDTENESLSKRTKSTTTAVECKNNLEESGSATQATASFQKLEVNNSCPSLPQTIKYCEVNNVKDCETKNEVQREATPSNSKQMHTASSSDSLLSVSVDWKSPKLLSPLKCEMEAKPVSRDDGDSSICNGNSKLLVTEIFSSSQDIQPLNLSKSSHLKASLSPKQLNDQNDDFVFSASENKSFIELDTSITTMMNKHLSSACLIDNIADQQFMEIDKENKPPPVPLNNDSFQEFSSLLVEERNLLVDMNPNESMDIDNQNIQATKSGENQSCALNIKTLDNEPMSLITQSEEMQLRDNVIEGSSPTNTLINTVNPELQVPFSLPTSNDTKDNSPLNTSAKVEIHNNNNNNNEQQNKNYSDSVPLNLFTKQAEDDSIKPSSELQNVQDDQFKNSEKEFHQSSNFSSSLPKKQTVEISSEQININKTNNSNSKMTNYLGCDHQIHKNVNCEKPGSNCNFEMKDDDMATDDNERILQDEDNIRNELNYKIPLLRVDEFVGTVNHPQSVVIADTDIKTVSNNCGREVCPVMVSNNVSTQNYISENKSPLYPSCTLGIQNLMMDTARFHESIYNSMGIDICNLKQYSSEITARHLSKPQFDLLHDFTDFRISPSVYNGDLSQNCLLNVEKWIQSFQTNQQCKFSNALDSNPLQETSNPFPHASRNADCENRDGKFINDINGGKLLVLTNNSMQKLFNSELDSSEFSGFCSDSPIPLPLDLSYTAETEPVSSYPYREDLVGFHGNHAVDKSSEFSVQVEPSSEDVEWDQHVDKYITRNVVNKEVSSSYKYSGEF